MIEAGEFPTDETDEKSQASSFENRAQTNSGTRTGERLGASLTSTDAQPGASACPSGLR